MYPLLLTITLVFSRLRVSEFGILPTAISRWSDITSKDFPEDFLLQHGIYYQDFLTQNLYHSQNIHYTS